MIFSIILTRSTRDSACIFSIARLRWTFTVLSAVPSSAAICLLSMPDDKHGDHLLLARSQRVEALLEFRYFFLLFTSGTISLQCDANRIQQILIAEWLGEEFNCPSFDSANTHWNVAMASEKNYGNTNVSRCQLALKVEATQSRAA